MGWEADPQLGPPPSRQGLNAPRSFLTRSLSAPPRGPGTAGGGALLRAPPSATEGSPRKSRGPRVRVQEVRGAPGGQRGGWRGGSLGGIPRAPGRAAGARLPTEQGPRHKPRPQDPETMT